MAINPETILSEIRSEKFIPTCGKHGYVASRKKNGKIRIIPPEPNGCKDCWFAYYLTDHALTPPEKRQERLDELEEVIHHTVEFAQKGKFSDMELYEPGDPRFVIEHALDAADDDTGEDKIPDPTKEDLNANR